MIAKVGRRGVDGGEKNIVKLWKLSQKDHTMRDMILEKAEDLTELHEFAKAKIGRAHV